MPYKDLEVRRIKARAYSRAWKERNPGWQEQHNAERRERYASDPEYRSAQFKQHPKHVKAAHMRVYKAIKRGEITRPSSCEDCGRETYVEAAHINYTERLAIRWLCRPCHRSWDGLHPKTEEPPETRQFEPRRLLKLTPEMAADIRASHAAGESQVSMAARHGVSRATVGNVIKGKAWC